MKKAERRLRVYAWLLLAVFSTMVALSSLHQHAEVASASHYDCELCDHHVAHSGHISTNHSGIDNCVLCQFLGLSYIVPAATALVVPIAFTLAVFATGERHIAAGAGRTYSSRAPPFLVF